MIPMQPVARVHSPFREKFGIPRQSGLVDATAIVELLPPYNVPEAVRGLEQFSHLWLIFAFHAIGREWRPLVRPPRLGGNARVGVFASRATHRPNPLGLSVVSLLGGDVSDGVRLHVRGADLLDGTPVLDIKPYIPYADSRPEARGGYAAEQPVLWPVHWPAGLRESLLASAPEQVRVIEQVLAQNPRPAYQQDDTRAYGVRLFDLNVRFAVRDDGVHVLSVEPVTL